MAEWLPEHIITLVVSAIAAALASGFAVKIRYRKTTLSNSQHAENGVNLREINNSTIQIQNSPVQPLQIESKQRDQSELKETIRGIIRRIGKEKISVLLQEAKLVALESKDQEMQKWIGQELAGYEPPGKAEFPSVENKEFARTVPDYRSIKGKFSIQFADTGEIEDLDYPFKMGHAVTSIESFIERLLKGNVIVTQKITFPKDLEYFGGKTGKVELPVHELQSVIRGVERKLSQYLEAKLIE